MEENASSTMSDEQRKKGSYVFSIFYSIYIFIASKL